MFNRPINYVAFATPLSLTRCCSSALLPTLSFSLRSHVLFSPTITLPVDDYSALPKHLTRKQRHHDYNITASSTSSSSSGRSSLGKSSSGKTSSGKSTVGKGKHTAGKGKRRARGRTAASRNSWANDKWDRVQPGARVQVADQSSSSLSSTLMEIEDDQEQQRRERVPRTNDLRPENCPALVLNADFSPLSYMPLSLWPWQEVVKAVFLDRVTVVATYDVGIRSPGMFFPLPSVISLKEYQPYHMKTPAFTRFNVFLRDGFSCQYCGRRFPTQDLTFDHVVPRCLGGKTNWGNVVTACVRCNHAKGRLLLKDLPNMKLKRTPVEPSNSQLQASARRFPPQYLHESWRDYVYWSQSMHVEGDDDEEQQPRSKGVNFNLFK